MTNHMIRLPVFCKICNKRLRLLNTVPVLQRLDKDNVSYIENSVYRCVACNKLFYQLTTMKLVEKLND